jgi:hypothetical protein
MKERLFFFIFFRRYIHEPCVRGNSDEIIPPHVIIIKIGLPYKAWQLQRNFIPIGTKNRAKVKTYQQITTQMPYV